jgi:hypothetical protein
MGAKSLEKAFEVQGEYVKTAYEGFAKEHCRDKGKHGRCDEVVRRHIEGLPGNRRLSSRIIPRDHVHLPAAIRGSDW